MNNGRGLDCIVIGYNDPPFEVYEGLLAKYGEESEAYRDLKYSFLDLEGRKLPYMSFLNHVFQLAGRNGASGEAEYRSCEPAVPRA